jgi:hypothetical protein
MPCLLGMRAGLLFPMENRPAHLAPNRHAASVRIIMLRLQHAAQVLGLDEDVIVVGIPDAPIELRRAVGSRVRRVRGALHDGVVVDARVHQDAARVLAFVEAVYAERLGVLAGVGKREGGGYLDIDATDLNVKVLC